MATPNAQTHDDPGIFIPIDLPNLIRPRVKQWREQCYPGTLPKGLTIADLKGEHRSQPHNSLLAECFYLIKYVEQWGTGTNRMLRLCKDAGLPEPIFDQKAGSFVVVFKRAKKRIEEGKFAVGSQ
ncbi:MAG: ATP-binding protein [bacterium]